MTRAGFLTFNILLWFSNHSFAYTFQCPSNWEGGNKIGESSNRPGTLRCEYEGDIEVKDCKGGSLESNFEHGTHCDKVIRLDPQHLLILQMKAHWTDAKGNLSHDCPTSWETHPLKIVSYGGRMFHPTLGRCFYDGRIALEDCSKWGGRKILYDGNENRPTCQKENENRQSQFIQLNNWSDKDWETVTHVGENGYLQVK